MVRITEQLVRKRAEHNEGEIFSLEEITLHQEGIERIEHLNTWCRDLKILYLQNNIIPKIENVGRLKKLEYLNLTLNNVKKVENLEGCESLTKLDLTVNFIAEVTSIESLRNNEQLKELFLTGNPCTQFEGYREYVIGTLQQLKSLDGNEIKNSERIIAFQNLKQNRREIIEQQKEYEQEQRRKYPENGEGDFNNNEESSSEDEEKPFDAEEESKFWEEKTDYTPESRIQMVKRIEKSNRAKEGVQKKDKIQKKRERRLFTEDGKPFNINEPKVEFQMIDDEENNQLIVDISIYRYMDTSLVDVDIHPNYVRVLIKKKIVQLALADEVKPDSSTAKRSQSSGHLILTMPKVAEPIKKIKHHNKLLIPEKTEDDKISSREFLDVKEDKNPMATLHQIAKSNKKELSRSIIERDSEADPNFVDNPDVPPLM